MLPLSVCVGDDADDQKLCSVFRVIFLLSVVSFIVNLSILTNSFSQRFSTYTALFRAILIIDLITNASYIIDSFSILFSIPQQNYEAYTHQKIDDSLQIMDCATYKPYLALIMLGQFWMSLIVFILGLERFLFIKYPLWFRAIRVRRTPVILFTLTFSLMATLVGYINSMFVNPEETTHYLCDTTWSFGAHYGWFQSGQAVSQQVTGCLFVTWSYVVVMRPVAIQRFGNQRVKMQTERRRIRKAFYFIITTFVFTGLPQLLLMLIHLTTKFAYIAAMNRISWIYPTKCIANAVLYVVMNDKSAQILSTIKKFMLFNRKNRIENMESIISVSYYVT